MRTFLYGSIIPLVLAGVLLAPGAHAETTTTANNEEMVAKIQALMAQLAELQKQFSAIQGEIKAVLKSGITEGSSSDDVKSIQEILATDSTIYPEGKITGYFGPMTKEALMRFQKRHNLTVTGVVDEETKAFLESYMEERSKGTLGTKGILGAPDMMKRVEDRVRFKCDNSGKGKGVGPLCERLKHHDDSDEMEDESEDDKDHEDDSTSDTVTFKSATKAIRDAQKSIADAVREIRKSDTDTSEANTLLSDAKKLVLEATKARNEGDFETATTKAEKSDEVAENAKDAAKEDGDEVEDEDEDEEDEDEDD
jgi:hypothetical protein